MRVKLADFIVGISIQYTYWLYLQWLQRDKYPGETGVLFMKTRFLLTAPHNAIHSAVTQLLRYVTNSLHVTIYRIAGNIGGNSIWRIAGNIAIGGC